MGAKKSAHEQARNDLDREDHVAERGNPATKLTFNGKIELQNFEFSGSNHALRRSNRLSGKADTLETIPVPTPSSPASSKTVGKRSRNRTASAANKRQKTASGYAPPSTYAHLSLLPDAVAQDLVVMFVGLNPGIQTARSGHAYAHPSNLFWKLLFSSGLTSRPCRPEEDRQMPELFRLGFTNIVSRPSRNGAELSKQEMDDGVAALHEKAREWRPRAMCIVGKSIWESIWRVRHGKAVGKDFKYGWQDETENMGHISGQWAGARVFVATSTSGLAASQSPDEKRRIWNELGSWAIEQREKKVELPIVSR